MRKGIVLGVVLFLVQIPLVALTLIHSDVFGGPNHDDARRVAFAPDGGVYVAGTTLSADGDSDVHTQIRREPRAAVGTGLRIAIRSDSRLR